MLDMKTGEFSEDASALMPESLQPGIFLQDHQFPHISDAEVIAEIRAMAPDATVIVVSSSLAAAGPNSTGEARALAFFPKTDSPIDVSTSVAALLRTASATPAVRDELAIGVELTRKQTAVLTLVAQGKSNKEASKSLRMSPETVKSHLSQIYRRLKVANRAEAVNAALQCGII